MLNPDIITLLRDGHTKVLDLNSYLAPEQDLTEADVIALAQHLPNSQIDLLNMSGVGLTYNGVVAIIYNAQRSNITELTLSYNELNDAAATYIANNLGNIRSIDLSGNNITNNGAIALAQRLAGSNLQNLELDDNNIDANVTQVFRDALVRYPYMTEITLTFNDPQINQYIERNNEILGFATETVHTLKDINNISSQNIRALNKQDYQAFEIFYKTGKINLLWELDEELMQQANLERKELICTKIQQAISNYYPQITHIVRGEHLESDMARNASLADLDHSGLLGEVFQYCDVSDVHY